MFEVGADPLWMPTMPVEFSVGAFRFGHSMVRELYAWNAVFPERRRLAHPAVLLLRHLRRPRRQPDAAEQLDRRLAPALPFSQIGRDDLKPPRGEFNLARRIDTGLVNPLSVLPQGSFGGADDDEGTIRANLAFRNLTRAGMVKLASGQQMADLPARQGRRRHDADQGPAQGRARRRVLALTPRQRTASSRTPRCGSTCSARPSSTEAGSPASVPGSSPRRSTARWREHALHRAQPGLAPELGPVDGRFRMTDLLVFAFENKKKLLAPLGD